jgi:hypothetical protein
MPSCACSTPSFPPAARHPSSFHPLIERLRRALFALAWVVVAGPSVAQTASPVAAPPPEVKSAWDAPEPWRTDRFYVQTSVATVHFSPDEDHVNNTKLIYGEWRLNERWLEGQVLVGASFFDNSFGQASQFVFGGLLWRPIEKAQEFYIKVAAGIIHGYSGEFQNKIPMNSSGFAPGIVPAVGYCYNRFCGEMILFGTAGMLWTVGMTIP